MKLVRSIAMFTDHSYHGKPVEISRVDLYMDEHIQFTEDELAVMKENQKQRLLHMAKRMPHKFWQEHPELEHHAMQEPILGYTLHKIKGEM